LTAAVVLPVVLGAIGGVHSPLFIVSVIIAVFVFWTHRANIGRLRRGEEHRFGKKARA
jgi:glycerol-3-phosphate acyltransferase PlsY